MNQTEFSVSFLPQEEDLIRERLLLGRLQRRPAAVLTARIAGLALAVGGLAVLLTLGMRSVTAVLLADGMVLAGYVLAVLYDVILPFFERRRAKKEFAGCAAARESRTVRIDGETLSVETASEQGVYPLGALMKVLECREAFAFAADGQTVWTLPKRALSEEELFRLTALLQEACGERLVWIELSPARRPKSKQERK